MSRSLAAAALLCAAACNARPPGHLEQVVATAVKRRIMVGGRADRNPVPATPETIRDGEATFLANCAMCHGIDGRNTGVPFARTMSPPVPELISRDVQAYTDGQLHSIVENGLSPSGMPAARGILSEAEMWRVVLYVRHLANAANGAKLANGQTRAAVDDSPP